MNHRFCGLAVLGFFVVSMACGQGSFFDLWHTAALPHVPGELLVQFRTGASEGDRTAALACVSGVEIEHIYTRSMKDLGEPGFVRLQVQGSVFYAILQLATDPNVECAEPNWIYRHMDASNDTYYVSGNLWGMYGVSTNPANAFGSGAGAAWNNRHFGNRTAFVGVIDEGVMHSHPDLAKNIWSNRVDVVDGLDNDGNGYVDDVRGWDFFSNDNSTYDGPGDDHGTHVAGTIGATGGNGAGVAGVSWNVRIITAKFLGSSGGTTANAIKAIDYITDLKTRQSLNIVATNNSWGGGGFSQLLQNAIERANVAGILFCAAAGNGGSDQIGDNNDVVANYPSNYPNANIIAVAAITSGGALAGFSNYGATKVDIGAPGVGVISTVPTSTNGFSYAYYSGTSMATPHVTGACALYSPTGPGMVVTAATIKSAIMSRATPTASLTGKCVSNGRLNVSGF